MDEEGEAASVRQILSKNLRRLIDDARETRPHLGSILKVAEWSRKISHGNTTLSKSRVGRIVIGSHPTDIDAVNDLAQAFDLQPWQLLVENLNPKALPRLVDAEFLSQLKAVVDVASSTNKEKLTSATDELPLKQEAGPDGTRVGPALQQAIGAGRGKDAGRATPKAAKQRSRRGR